MKFKLLLSCFLVALAGNVVTAQKDKKNGDVQVIDFGADDHESETPKQEYHGLLLKTNPFSFVFGAQWLDLEKEINEYLSLQVGVGARFNSLLGYSYSDLIAELSESTDCPDIEPCDDYTDYTYRSDAKVGPYFAFSPRFFYESDGFEGVYIAPFIRYSKLRYDVQKIEEGAYDEIRLPDDFQKESIRDLDLVIHYGYQKLHPKLTTEWFMGLGARFQKSKRQDIIFDYQNDTYHNGSVSFKNTFLRIEFGFRLGFQL